MRNDQLSRITIDIPAPVHKKFKALAAASGKSMREMVIEYINNKVEECTLPHTPNKKTALAIENVEKDENLTESKDMQDFLKKIGL